MEIVQVCPLFYPYTGGVETHVKEISKRLSALGVNVKVYTTDPSGQLPRKEVIEGIEVFRFRSFSPKHVYFFSPKLYYTLKSLKNIDAIHVHGYPNFPALAAAVAKKNRKKSLVFTPHYGGYLFSTMGSGIGLNLAKKCYHRSLGKYIFSKVDTVVTVGRFERDLLKQKFGLGEQKIKYIPNGVDTEKFEKLERKPGNTKTLLYVGRLEKYKGIHFLLKAFPKIKRSMSDLKVVVVGKGSFKEELKSLVSSLNIQDNVEFLENVPEDDLIELYLSSCAFVYLSQYEGLPVAVLEAMACGLPVIATRVGGIPEVVQQAETGFLLNFPPDEKELIDRIALLLDDCTTSTHIGIRAKETVLSTFSWNHAAKNLKELYEEYS